MSRKLLVLVVFALICTLGFAQDAYDLPPTDHTELEHDSSELGTKLMEMDTLKFQAAAEAVAGVDSAEETNSAAEQEESHSFVEKPGFHSSLGQVPDVTQRTYPESNADKAIRAAKKYAKQIDSIAKSTGAVPGAKAPAATPGAKTLPAAPADPASALASSRAHWKRSRQGRQITTQQAYIPSRRYKGRLRGGHSDRVGAISRDAGGLGRSNQEDPCASRCAHQGGYQEPQCQDCILRGLVNGWIMRSIQDGVKGYNYHHWARNQCVAFAKKQASGANFYQTSFADCYFQQMHETCNL